MHLRWFGEYEGGEIWHEDMNPGSATTPLQSPCPTGPGVQYLDARGRWVRFNAQRKHAVRDFTGTRISIICTDDEE